MFRFPNDLASPRVLSFPTIIWGFGFVVRHELGVRGFLSFSFRGDLLNGALNSEGQFGDFIKRWFHTKTLKKHSPSERRDIRAFVKDRVPKIDHASYQFVQSHSAPGVNHPKRKGTTTVAIVC